MSKFGLAGLFCWILSGFLVIYQGIKAVMGDDYIWENIYIEDLVSPKSLNWIDSLPADFLAHTAVFILSVPIYILLLVLGGIGFFISSFYKG